MKASPTLRVLFYLLLSLLGMLLGSLFPLPFSSLCHLLFVLLALGVEKKCFAGAWLPRLSIAAVKSAPSLFLLFPVFGFLTLGANLLSSHIAVSFGGSVPVFTPSFSLFLGAVVLAPIAEELLFRGLLLHLLEGFGERWAIVLSACLFALAHGALFQIPYALVAGLLLGYAAVCGKGLFYPLVFHFLYNLLTFFGNLLSPAILLAVLGGAALLSLVLLLCGKKLSFPKKGNAPTLTDALPLLFYGFIMLAFAFGREFL